MIEAFIEGIRVGDFLRSQEAFRKERLDGVATTDVGRGKSAIINSVLVGNRRGTDKAREIVYLPDRGSIRRIIAV